MKKGICMNCGQEFNISDLHWIKDNNNKPYKKVCVKCYNIIEDEFVEELEYSLDDIFY